MKLLGTIGSPYVRKVRIFFAEKKIDYEWVLINDLRSENSSIVQYNPLGKVPCLLVDSKDELEAIFDSRVIVEYADKLRPGLVLIPEQGRERARLLTWEALADGVVDAAANIRRETSWEHRSKAQQCQAWIDFQMNKVHHSLTAMEKGVSSAGFVVGASFSLADIATDVALGYLDKHFPELRWRETRPNLAAIYRKLQERPSFLNTQSL